MMRRAGFVTVRIVFSYFFFNDTATSDIYPLPLPDALPIYVAGRRRLPEHLELALVPAADDVDAGTPVAHMIDGHQRLGDEDGMDERHVDRRKDGRALGDRRESRRLRQRFER